MPIGPKGERRPVNPIESGIMVARIATGDIEEEYVERPKQAPNRAKGGKRGGKQRADSLTPERRSEIARDAANARWRNGHDSPKDHSPAGDE